MKRVLKADVIQLACLKRQIKRLQAQEKELTAKLIEALPEGETVIRDRYEVRWTYVSGQPKVKDAFIEALGEEAYEALPRTEYPRLSIKGV